MRDNKIGLWYKQCDGQIYHYVVNYENIVNCLPGVIYQPWIRQWSCVETNLLLNTQFETGVSMSSWLTKTLHKVLKFLLRDHLMLAPKFSWDVRLHGAYRDDRHILHMSLVLSIVVPTSLTPPILAILSTINKWDRTEWKDFATSVATLTSLQSNYHSQVLSQHNTTQINSIKCLYQLYGGLILGYSGLWGCALLDKPPQPVVIPPNS